eukprot:scaffold104089_cov35-Prasinocladus_malaysianus.AAC.1
MATVSQSVIYTQPVIDDRAYSTPCRVHRTNDFECKCVAHARSAVRTISSSSSIDLKEVCQIDCKAQRFRATVPPPLTHTVIIFVHLVNLGRERARQRLTLSICGR